MHYVTRPALDFLSHLSKNVCSCHQIVLTSLTGVNLNVRMFSQHPTINDELPNRILSGTVQVKPNIRRFQGSSVEFEDGSLVEDVDLVVGLVNHVYTLILSH